MFRKIARRAWILVASATIASPAFSALYCYESDKVDRGARSPWSHHHFVLMADEPMPIPDGKVFMGLRGYGYNDAPTPNGSTDLVALVGAAVKDIDGTWLVGTQGTLLQQSLLYAADHAGRPSYWIISQNWILDTHGNFGIGHFGNLTTPFNNQFEHAVDDSVDVTVWRVACPKTADIEE